MTESMQFQVPANPDAKIALEGVKITARVTGFSQIVTVEQQFRNQEAVAIEAQYTFPLPEQAAVCGCEIITGDRILTARIEDSEKAREVFDQAITAGHGAFLADQNRPDIFTMSAGNLLPGQAALIRLRYVEPVELHERKLRLCYPTTIAPRYVSLEGKANPVQAECDGEQLNPPHLLQVPYGFSFTLLLDAGREVRSIASPSHRITIPPAGDGVPQATLAAGVGEMNRDLVIEAELAAELAPVALAIPDPTNPAEPAAVVSVTFLPELDAIAAAGPAKAEIVFVLDCSGSMGGESITQAKNALALCLRSMNPGDSFNIIRFGSTHEAMTPQAWIYSESTLRQSLDWLAKVDADLGGTELHPVLTPLLAQKLLYGCECRDIILLTDGQVANESALIALARSHAGTNRFFTFGIGSACSQYLLRGLARATAGAAEFITANERIEEKVLRTFSRIGAPAFTGITIDWGSGNRTVQSPAQLPSLFPEEPLTVYARVEGKLPKQVTLRCRCGARKLEWSAPVRRCGQDQDNGLAALWARERIRELTGDQQDGEMESPARLSRQAQRDRHAVVELSRQYGILSPYTSFIAVEHRSLQERNDGRPELRRVPLQLAQGWHGIDTDTLEQCSECEPLLFVHESCNFSAPMASGSRKVKSMAMPPAAAAMPCASMAAPEPPESMPVLLELLASQNADGGFNIKPKAIAKSARQAGVDLPLAELVAGLAGSRLEGLCQDDKQRDTLLVLLLLRIAFHDRKKLWSKAADKAMRWLCAGLGLTRKDVDAELAAQEKLVSPVR